MRNGLMTATIALLLSAITIDLAFAESNNGQGLPDQNGRYEGQQGYQSTSERSWEDMSNAERYRAVTSTRAKGGVQKARQEVLLDVLKNPSHPDAKHAGAIFDALNRNSQKSYGYGGSATHTNVNGQTRSAPEPTKSSGGGGGASRSDSAV